MSNIYSYLIDDQNENKETENLKRKAVKKLREIQSLKKKKIKTPEEYQKIQQEDCWKAIVCPVDHLKRETTCEEIYKRKEKQHDKTKRELERKLCEAKQQKEKLECKILQQNDKMKRIDFLEKKLYATQKLNEILREKLQKTGINGNSLSFNSAECRIKNILKKEIEDKTWKKVIFKLHPDRLSSHIGDQLANEISKIANELKPIN